MMTRITLQRGPSSSSEFHEVSQTQPSSNSDDHDFDMVEEASSLPNLAQARSLIGLGRQLMLNASNTYWFSPQGRVDVASLVSSSAPMDLLNRLQNVWDVGLDPAARGRLGDNTFNALLREIGVTRSESQVQYIEAVPGPGLSSEQSRILGEWGLIKKLEAAFEKPPTATSVATTYTIPGLVENHIVTIYVKNAKLHYVDPKGDPAPLELQNALLDLSTKYGFQYNENQIAYQQDTMSCGFYAAYILQQLHEGKEPELQAGIEWIEAVKKKWFDEILDRYRMI